MNIVKKEHEKNESKDKTVLRRALLWILGYFVLMNIGDEIGRQTGLGNLVTALLLVGFSGVLLKTHRLQDLLLQLPARDVYARVWFFIPLLVLALLVAKTRSIIPGAIFHALFNFSGTVTNQDAELQAMLLVPILVISVLYSIIVSRKSSKGVVVAG